MKNRTQPAGHRSLPLTVWVLGLVSLFMDISSEMVHSLLPVFLVTVLGASVTWLGVIEGAAEATALVTRLFSGALSDRIGKRKPIAVAGYGIGALSKPLFALSTGAAGIFSARLFDRLGKGIRGAPRDALVADVTPADRRGAAFGLRQSLDTAGAFLGPMLATLFMILLSGNIRAVFWLALIPGLISVALLVSMVKEPPVASKPASLPFRFRNFSRLGLSCWMVIALGFVFALSRFSEAFLLLRAANLGLHTALVPLMMVVMNIMYSLTAYPAGLLSDRYGRSGMMTGGLAVLVAADLVMAFSHQPWHAAVGCGLWGIQLGMTQGVLSAMIADTAPEELRGTAFGFYGLAGGVALLAASLTAGILWDAFGAAAAFLAGAAFAFLTLIGLRVIMAILPATKKMEEA